jgi:hypothetical protein
MANNPSEKLPRIKVSSAYPGEWYIVEVDGGDGAVLMELRRPVGEESSDAFHLDIKTSHTHEGVESVHLTFTGPATTWPDFIRCIQAIASIFDTLPTTPLDREKVREHFFKNKK